MDSSNPIFIVLPVHNRRAITARFIACLKKQHGTPYRLILVDDGSTDGTAEMVLHELPETVVLRGDGNLWWGGALEEARKWLAREAPPHATVMLANDDTEFEGDLLQTALRELAQNPDAIILAHCFDRTTRELIDRGTIVDWSRLNFRSAAPDEAPNCLSTRGLFLRVSDFEKIGGFHPRLIPHYGSDYEFTIRAHRKGFRLLSSPALKVWLDGTATGTHQLPQASWR
jgi:GT2 family glycosyltransferase